MGWDYVMAKLADSMINDRLKEAERARRAEEAKRHQQRRKKQAT
jgi:hypothetical protein